MLKLRREHLEAFERQAANLFCARVLSHVRVVWPSECSELGDVALNELVQSAIQRATKIGLHLEHDVVRYVDLSFLLANDFENKPQANWTTSILSDSALSPTTRIDRLYQRIEEELSRMENRKGRQA